MWESPNGECQKCRCTIDRGEADHITPLRDAIAGQRQSFRLLCQACPREVIDSTARRAANPIISMFSIGTYKGFVESVRPTQFVMPLQKIDPKLELIYLDVRRCRRSCLVESTEPWPVFCAHDQFMRLALNTSVDTNHDGNVKGFRDGVTEVSGKCGHLVA